VVSSRALSLLFLRDHAPSTAAPPISPKRLPCKHREGEQRWFRPRAPPLILPHQSEAPAATPPPRHARVYRRPCSSPIRDHHRPCVLGTAPGGTQGSPLPSLLSSSSAAAGRSPARLKHLCPPPAPPAKVPLQPLKWCIGGT
jgi:hypothetical protein